MEIAIAIFCFVASSAAFLFGFVTEIRQARRIRAGEVTSLVPTLPNAVAAAIFLMLGLCLLPIPWWIAPFGFVFAVVVFGKRIMRAANYKSDETNNETSL